MEQVLAALKGELAKLRSELGIAHELNKASLKEILDYQYALDASTIVAITDKFGGERGKKYSAKRFKETLLSIQHLNMEEQGNFLKNAIQEWKGNLEQVYDICLLGIRI